MNRTLSRCYLLGGLFLAGGALLVLGRARAQDFRSDSFLNRDPVIIFSSRLSTSTNFQLIGGAGQIVVGESSSSVFTGRSGFYYFPDPVTSPVVAATAGNGQAALTWSAAVGSLGLNPQSYQVGQSTVSGGPYTFTSVGNVLASTRSGLTNGTVHYFVVRVHDIAGAAIATSSQVSATPVAPAAPAGPGGGGGSSGGGGGGGGAPTPAPAVETAVNVSGWAYPKSSVTLLKDAQIVATTVAGPDAKFDIKLTGLSAGNYIFYLYSEDDAGRRSSLTTFPVGVTSGAATNVSGIFLAPTVAVDKSEVKRGETVAIFGQTVPQADLIIQISSEEDFFLKTTANASGVYRYIFDTSPLDYGNHLAKSKAAFVGEISPFSRVASFVVGQRTVATLAPRKCPVKADLNRDCKVNLVDFSIAAYWYQRKLSATFLPLEKKELNGDGKVDLVDFSIIAYHWTG
ncbi:MAG: hypothetical protein HYV42_05775 [Candidatus Magasanikbacteria bacterium]|nr:hypothetical protein [Candidatus Magasanikbacteria bacterium]